MNKSKSETLRIKLQKVLEQFAKENGIGSVTPIRAGYNHNSVAMKFTFLESGNVWAEFEEKYKNLISYNATGFEKMKQSWLGKTIIEKGVQYQLKGVNPRGRSAKVIMEKVGTSDQYNFPCAYATRLFTEQFESEVQEEVEVLKKEEVGTLTIHPSPIFLQSVKTKADLWKTPAKELTQIMAEFSITGSKKEIINTFWAKYKSA